MANTHMRCTRISFEIKSLFTTLLSRPWCNTHTQKKNWCRNWGGFNWLSHGFAHKSFSIFLCCIASFFFLRQFGEGLNGCVRNEPWNKCPNYVEHITLRPSLPYWKRKRRTSTIVLWVKSYLWHHFPPYGLNWKPPLQRVRKMHPLT